MKTTVIIYGTSTGTCEDLAGRIGAKLGVDNIINVTDLDASVLADNENLILDTSEDVDWLVKKVAALRIFDDENGVMNRSLVDVEGEALVVSQFTLYASYKKGNRPSWFRAARHEISVPLYEEFCRKLSDAIGKQVGTGEFGADMKVELLNDGPVTICMDTKNKE